MKAILRLTYLCLSLLFLSLTASAQDVQVKGQVVDDKGEAVIGASIKVKETVSVVVLRSMPATTRSSSSTVCPSRTPLYLVHPASSAHSTLRTSLR